MTLSPQQIVEELNKHIIGQDEAKRAVAIALRNRWRRTQVDPELRYEITPKNILMIGPTGVGKTEIARRLAKLANAPFIKVEATKFTEVGYVGREVDSIIRDLMDAAINMVREQELKKVEKEAALAAEDRILDALLPPPRSLDRDGELDRSVFSDSTREKFRELLRKGSLDEKEIKIEIQEKEIGLDIIAPPGMEEVTTQLQEMMKNLSGGRRQTKQLRIKDALKLIKEEEANKRINHEDLKLRALELVEEQGIVFIDELDKVTSNYERSGADVSREGVQRDLLPLVEGCTVSTKHGMVKTDHILFIASGAFHLSKPSDLIPELQGRLPIRVELSALSIEDFMRILVEPNASLTEQYIALMATEGVELSFSEDGIRRIAEIAWQVNERTENIGARRLHTVLERLLEDISFRASELKGQKILIDAQYVDQQLSDLALDEDLSRFIL